MRLGMKWTSSVSLPYGLATGLTLIVFYLYLTEYGPLYKCIGTIHLQKDTTTLHYVASYYENKTEFRPFAYHPPPFANVSTDHADGKAFNISDKVLEILGIPLTDFVELSEDIIQDFVLVTGVSSNHFTESLRAISTIQQHLPQHKILYYDLGLVESQITQLKSFCGVTYRIFNYSNYPTHVRNLHTYAFKPLLVHEALRDHPSVMWFDSSCRLSRNLTSLYPSMLSADGVTLLTRSSRRNYHMTQTGMFKYLPSSMEKQKTTIQAQGQAFVVRTKSAYWGAICWWIMCALDADCITPNGSIRNHSESCQVTKEAYGSNACHRQDQSAINILLSNMYSYDVKRYSVTGEGIVKYIRGITPLELLVKTCAQTDSIDAAS